MPQFVLIIHVIISVCLIAMILIQHGKGADAGASFGSGASQTIFGSQGSASFLTRVTAILAALFLLNCLLLGYLSAQQTKQKRDPLSELSIPVTKQAPVAPKNNAIEQQIPGMEQEQAPDKKNQK